MKKIALEEAFYYFPPGKHLDPSVLAGRLGLREDFYRDRWDRLQDIGELRLAVMNASDVEIAVLSHNSPGTQATSDPAIAQAQARDINDFLAAQVTLHPDRFAGFASLPTHDGETAAGELRRAVEQLGFVGALVNGFTDTADGALYLDDIRFEPLWDELENLNVPLYLHPRVPSGDWSAMRGHTELLGPAWGFAPETASHVLRLVFSGVFDRHPRLKLIIGHLGEGLLTTLERSQEMFAEMSLRAYETQRTLPEYFADNVYITTSGNFSSPALISAVLAVGADNLLFSIDYPFSDSDAGSRWLDSAPISPNDRRKIAWRNAAKLLRLDVNLSDLSTCSGVPVTFDSAVYLPADDHHPPAKV